MNDDKPDAYLLVAHGSRDSRPQRALAQLAHEVYARLSNPDTPLSCTKSVPKISHPVISHPVVHTACLELAEAPLHQQILAVTNKLTPEGVGRLRILPLFLLPGVHVMQDIPEEVERAAQTLSEGGSAIALDLLPYLGQHPGMIDLISAQIVNATALAAAPILLAHGSRYAAGNRLVESVATAVGAIPAYWSIPDSLDQQVQYLIHQGREGIAVIPYFLFAGSTTDAIEQKIQVLETHHPSTQFHLGDPIMANPHLANIITMLLVQN